MPLLRLCQSCDLVLPTVRVRNIQHTGIESRRGLRQQCTEQEEVELEKNGILVPRLLSLLQNILERCAAEVGRLYHATHIGRLQLLQRCPGCQLVMAIFCRLIPCQC
jgi:hypothetical protein